MNTSFNFGSLGTVQAPNNISYLKPYTINDNVTIKGTEIKQGTSKNGNEWKCLQITFGNEDGIYNESIFWINSEKDFERGEQTTKEGGKRPLPSNWERTRDKIAAIGLAFNPEKFQKVQELAKAGKIKSFDDLAAVFKKVVDEAIGKNPTSMKLVGRNSNGTIYAALPNCTGMAQATTEKAAASNDVNIGEWYTWMVTPFGDKLFFSAYEEQQKSELANAKPTKMPASSSVAAGIDEVQSGSEDIDFESLL